MLTVRIQKFFAVSFILLSTLLSGCKIDAPVTVNVPNPPSNINVGSVNVQSLTCAAYIAADASQAVEPDKTIPVTLQVGGGSAPYSVNGIVGTFLTQVNIDRTYSNDTNNNLVVNDSIVVKDNSGTSVTCALTVTVLPKSTPSDLACALTSTKSSYKLGEEVEYTATVSGGTSPYAFVSFAPGNGGTITSSLTTTNATTAKAKATYSIAGNSTATVIASDITGNKVSCTKAITVQASPYVTVTVSPAATVWSDQVVTLTPLAYNFQGPVTYTYTTTESKAVITRNGSLAFVSVSDFLSHSFNVLVSATDGTSTVSLNIALSFVSRVVTTNPLTCTAYTYYNPSYLDEEVYVYASVPANSGVGTVRLINISAPQNSYMSYHGASGLLAGYVSFGNVGNYTVTLTVQDDAGNTASCSTLQTVNYYYGNYYYWY